MARKTSRTPVATPASTELVRAASGEFRVWDFVLSTNNGSGSHFVDSANSTGQYSLTWMFSDSHFNVRRLTGTGDWEEIATVPFSPIPGNKRGTAFAVRYWMRAYVAGNL